MALGGKVSPQHFERPVFGVRQCFGSVLIGCNGRLCGLLGGFVTDMVPVNGVSLFVVQFVVKPSEPLLQLGHFGGGRGFPGRLRSSGRHVETMGWREGVGTKSQRRTGTKERRDGWGAGVVLAQGQSSGDSKN